MRFFSNVLKTVAVLALLSAFLPERCFSQNRFNIFRDNGYYILGVNGGGVIPNEPSDSPVLGGVFTSGVNLGVGARMTPMDESENWKKLWRCPYFGLKLGYEHITSKVVGERFSLGAFIEMPFAVTSHWDFAAFFDFGMSYLTNTYDSLANPDNMFIGSHLNALISLGLQANWHVTDRTALYTQLAFSHSSNGTLQLPNKGINIMRMELGAKIRFTDGPYPVAGQQRKVVPDVVVNGPRRNSIFLNLSPVYNSSRKTWEHHFSASASIGYRRMGWGNVFAYGGGVDFMYDASLEKAHEPHLPENNYAVSAYGLLEAYWGRFSLRGAVGYYAWRGCDFALPFYERIGVYYSFGKRVWQYVGASIKAHAAHAQFLEWTYGVELFRF